MNIEQIQDEIIQQNHTGKDQGFDAGYAAGYKAAMMKIGKLASDACFRVSDHIETIGHGDNQNREPIMKPIQRILHSTIFYNGKKRFRGQTSAKRAFMSED